jgi:hypothetical protein
MGDPALRIGVYAIMYAYYYAQSFSNGFYVEICCRLHRAVFVFRLTIFPPRTHRTKIIIAMPNDDDSFSWLDRTAHIQIMRLLPAHERHAATVYRRQQHYYHVDVLRCANENQKKKKSLRICFSTVGLNVEIGQNKIGNGVRKIKTNYFESVHVQYLYGVVPESRSWFGSTPPDGLEPMSK